jgi:ankyrin repeat protein
MPCIRIVIWVFTSLVLLIACAKKPPALIPLAKKGNPTKVEKALQKDANVYEQDPRGYTAIMVAAEGGHTAVVRLLIQ